MFLAAVNFLMIERYGLGRRTLPPRIRSMHRAMIKRNGPYRGERKASYAFRRFVRALRTESEMRMRHTQDLAQVTGDA